MFPTKDIFADFRSKYPKTGLLTYFLAIWAITCDLGNHNLRTDQKHYFLPELPTKKYKNCKKINRQLNISGRIDYFDIQLNIL